MIEECQGCCEIERIVTMETSIKTHTETLNKLDGKLDKLLDTVGGLKNNKGFIGGIAATGWLVGVLMYDAVKPLAKPLIALVISMLK